MNNLDVLVGKFKTYHSKTNQVVGFLSELENESLTFLDSDILQYPKETLQGLSKKLENPNIVISVVAEVASGKSTFLNTLLFRDVVLDSSVGATTATIFKIEYGDKYEIIASDYTKELENLEELKQEAKNYNQRIREKIENEEKVEINEVILKIPHEELKKGIILYDTPGFGALDEEKIFEILKNAIFNSDATIILLDVSKGLKKEEQKFIKTTLKSISADKRYILLNKLDMVVNDDQKELLSEEEIQSQIENVVNSTLKELSKISDISEDEIKHFELSAFKALVGYKKNDENKLKESNFENFEKSLWSNLIKQKEEVFNERISLFNKITESLQKLLDNAISNINSSRDEIVSRKNKVENQKIELEKTLNEIDKRLQKEREELFKNRNFDIEGLYNLIENSLEKSLKDKFDKISFIDSLQILKYKDLYSQKTKEVLQNQEKINEVIRKELNNFLEKLFNIQERINEIIVEANKQLEKFEIDKIEKVEVLQKENDVFISINETIDETQLKNIILEGIDENSWLELLSYYMKTLFIDKESFHTTLSKNISKDIIENLKKRIDDKLKSKIYEIEKLGELINKKPIEIQARFKVIEKSLESPDELENQINALNNEIVTLKNYQDKLQGVINE